MSKVTKLFQVFDDLPDLLAMATEIAEKEDGYSYEIQDKLREEYRQAGTPFKWSMPYRHIDSCRFCNYINTSILHQLENPKIQETSSPLRITGVSDMQIHEMREHKEAMPPELVDFLTQVAQQT